MYSVAFGWNVLQVSVKSIWSGILFKADVSLLIFCLSDLSIDESGVLKSPTIMVLPSISLSFFFLAALCWVFLSICSKWGLLFVAVHGLLIVVASFVVEHGL